MERIANAAAVLVKRGEVNHRTYRWWHREVRMVLNGHYKEDHLWSKLHIIAVLCND